MADGQGYIPVYMPDETVAGYARVRSQGESHTTIQIDVPKSHILTKLIEEGNLVGLSVMYMDRGAVEDIESKEKTDGKE